jgi:hypothetical protein
VQVYVFTDLQRRDGQVLRRRQQGPRQCSAGAHRSGPGGRPAPSGPDDREGPTFTDTVRDAIERLQKRAGTKCTGSTPARSPSSVGGTADNLQITTCAPCSRPPCCARPSMSWPRCEPRPGQRHVEVTLEVDGGEPMRKLVTVPAGAEGEADFQVTFRESGRRRLRASLQNDALEADDERFLAVEVRDRVRVLLVDGAAEDDPLRTYQYVWQVMLDPDPTTLPTFAVDTVDNLALLGGQCTPRNYDVTVLADVDRLNPKARRGAHEALQAGKRRARGVRRQDGSRELQPAPARRW